MNRQMTPVEIELAAQFLPAPEREHIALIQNAATLTETNETIR